MAKFFIHRPIFAWVVALVIMLAGILSLIKMPVAQYPTIAAPQINISASYPGASADTVENTVTQIIEQQLTGLDGMRYITATSSNNTASISVFFNQGVDADTAQVQVQNNVQSATRLLPQDVQRLGVRVNKGNTGYLQVIAMYSPDNSMSRSDISDYISTYMAGRLRRVEGVGDVRVFGSSYAMRIWLDPAKLASHSLTPTDVRNAVTAQNAQVAVGQIGALPTVEGQAINATVTAQSLLQTPEEFRKIILKNSGDGSIVYLGDVAKVEIGSMDYGTSATFNGQPSAGIGVSLATGANALDTAKAIEAALADMRPNYPAGMKDTVAYDTTPFVERSIKSVVNTLIEAVLLVFIVMFLFLQNWRATIIPTFAVPVVVLGTFAVISFFGYTINTLTMFAMVLAIGLLVDDAIVVVENVERLMVEEHLAPIAATEKSMKQITGALVGITAVLVAVFIPLSFMGGTTGVIYRQFSVTLITAMFLSLLVAIVFTPALCATMLKKHDTNKPQSNHIFARFFRKFNTGFDRFSLRYQNGVRRMISGRMVSLAVFVVLCIGLALTWKKMPSSFLPSEDQGMIMTMVQLPQNSSLQRTQEVMDKVSDYYLTKEKDTVQSVMAISGFGGGSAGQNQGMAFVRLKDWSERKSTETQTPALLQRARGLNAIPEAQFIAPVPLPIMRELGNPGVSIVLRDVAGDGHQKLQQASQALNKMMTEGGHFESIRPDTQPYAPQYKITIDQQKAGAMGVSLSEINNTMALAWSGNYVNDFLDRGSVKRVYIQGESASRAMPEDLNKWYVRNNQGQMVAFSSFATGEWTTAAINRNRYNGASSITINAMPVGMSSGDAMKVLEGYVAKLPEQGFEGYSLDWTGLSLEEQEVGSQKMVVFILAALMVFLILAALYESWSVPFSVLLVIPLGILGSVLVTFLTMLITKDTNMSNNIYFTVAIIAVAGLSAKNAILIVEFAKELQEEGEELLEATLHAAKMRLRPIIMTTLAFGFGVLPLALASGAGAAAQHSVGYGVLGGVLSSTVLGIFFIPIFFVVVRSMFKYKAKPTSTVVLEK
ncbi:efflux RND transporter permease subunit [Acinetobacter sp. c2-A9]|uniref:efflux RND transporter permease subunit n=1 Tax=Acinetobacter sp. c2-A9 TaxID=3342802 RepID=UPI0035B99A06